MKDPDEIDLYCLQQIVKDYEQDRSAPGALYETMEGVLKIVQRVRRRKGWPND